MRFDAKFRVCKDNFTEYFEMKQAFILLGSNLGNRVRYLAMARSLLNVQVGQIERVSQLYQTEPWGIENQPEFINQALALQTELTPLQLLEAVLSVEQQIGRERVQKWGQRIIDIDILFYGPEKINLTNLTIPHPFFHLRNFAMVPMAEIAPAFIHPVYGKTVFQLLRESPDELKAFPYLPPTDEEE